MGFKKIIVGFVFFLAMLSSAFAQEENVNYFAKESEPKSNSSFELWYQLYYPEDSDVFEEFFDREYLEVFGFSAGWYIVRNLDLILKAGYSERKGKAIGVHSGEKSDEDLKLILVPVQLELAYRFDFFDEQFLVPSAGVGYDWYYYKEDNEFSSDVEGSKGGWNATAGLAILLDRLDPTSRVTLEQDFGIENVFLNLEVRWCYIKEDNGFDFTGIGYSAGLLFEF